MSGNEFEQRALAQQDATDEPSDETAAPEELPEEDPPTSVWPARSASPEPSVEETPAVSENGSATVAEPPPHPPLDEAEVAAVEEAEDAGETIAVDEEPSDDPFAGWPQPQSGVVVEDEPLDGVSVEHVEGEIDVPDGYTVIEGTPLGRRRSVAVVVSRFNGGLTNRMLAKALDALDEAEVASDAVTVVPVPGAFELPLAAMALAKTRRYACVVALGAIVRGETPHFDFVASEAASGLQLAAIETGVPVAFGVLTVETVEQGEARIDRAADAVRAALEMADLFARLRASAH